MKATLRILPWIILLIPFVVLGWYYASLPDRMLIVRGLLGNEATFAPKSFFTVFRVPMIEIVCAVAIETMRHRFAHSPGYTAMWSILLYTVALKSLFQAFEVLSSTNYADLFYRMTLGLVAVGMIAALIRGRGFFADGFRGKWELLLADHAILLALLIGYLGLAIVPIFVFGRT